MLMHISKIKLVEILNILYLKVPDSLLKFLQSDNEFFKNFIILKQ